MLDKIVLPSWRKILKKKITKELEFLEECEGEVEQGKFLSRGLSFFIVLWWIYKVPSKYTTNFLPTL